MASDKSTWDSITDFFTGFLEDTFGISTSDSGESRSISSPDSPPLDEITPTGSNEQPTRIDTNLLVIALVVLVIFSLVGVWVFSDGPVSDPASTSSQTKEEETQDYDLRPSKDIPQTSNSGRQQGLRPGTPGTQSENRQSQGPGNLSSGARSQNAPEQDTLSPMEKANEGKERLREVLSRDPEKSSPNQVQGSSQNPYRSQPGPSSQSQSQRQTLKKAKEASITSSFNAPSLPEQAPEDRQFKPSEDGAPRHPASGRPMGQPPTPDEARAERQYQEGQSSSEESQSYQRRARRRHLTDASNLSESRHFLEKQRSKGSIDTDVNSVQGPLAPFTLPKGTIIPITLETTSSNELPGNAIMRVTRDVYDRTKRHILIPRGSEIVSSYSTAAQVGQDRLLVSANRLTLPDGRFVQFRDAKGAGLSGRAGLSDLKDRHLLQRFAAVGGLAVLGATVAITDPLAGVGRVQGGRQSSNSNRVILPGPTSLGARATAGFTRQINEVLSQLLEKTVQRKPTLTIRSGKRGILILNEDIDLKRPYYEDGQDDFERQNTQIRKYRQQRNVRRARQKQKRIQRQRQYRQRMRQIRGSTRRTRESMSREMSTPSPERSPPTYYYQEAKYRDGTLPTYMPPRQGMSQRERQIRRRYMPKSSPQSGTSQASSSGTKPPQNDSRGPSDQQRPPGGSPSAPPPPSQSSESPNYKPRSSGSSRSGG